MFTDHGEHCNGVVKEPSASMLKAMNQDGGIKIRPTLPELPHEIRANIFGYLRKRSDLSRVCLTCGRLRDAAVPLLYERLDLTLGGPQDSKIHKILSQRNPGVRHIKHLKIRVDAGLSRMEWLEQNGIEPSDPEGVPDGESSESGGFYHSSAQAQIMLGMILEMLPRDQLLSFNWNTWDPMTTENWLFLHNTQKQLQYAEIGPLNGPLMPAVKKRPGVFKGLSKVKSLCVWPNGIDALEASQVALQDTSPHLSVLGLDFRALWHSTSSSASMHDTSTNPGTISRTIFKHLIPFDRCTPLNLRELHLGELDIHHCSITLLKVINFQVLESLVLDGCNGASNLFAEMCKNYAHPSNLKRIAWLEDATQQQAVLAFEDWLQSFKGLQYIHVDIGYVTEVLKPLAIKNHAESLRSLFVRFGTTTGSSVKYLSTDVVDICERCTRLRQFSLPFPDLTVCAGNPFETDAVRSQILSATRLPELSTLCVQEWPAARLGEGAMKSPANVRYYNQQLALLATRIYEMADAEAAKRSPGPIRSNLSLIAFGTSPYSHYDGSDSVRLRQVFYMRGTLIDPFGVQKCVAVQIEKRHLREISEDESICGWDTGSVFKDLDIVLYKD